MSDSSLLAWQCNHLFTESMDVNSCPSNAMEFIESIHTNIFFFWSFRNHRSPTSSIPTKLLKLHHRYIGSSKCSSLLAWPHNYTHHCWDSSSQAALSRTSLAPPMAAMIVLRYKRQSVGRLVVHVMELRQITLTNDSVFSNTTHCHGWETAIKEWR